MDSVRSLVEGNAIVKKAAEGLEAARRELLRPGLADGRREELLEDMLFFAEAAGKAAKGAVGDVRDLGKRVEAWMK